MERYYQCLDCGCKFNTFGNDEDELREFEFCPKCDYIHENIKRIDGY